METMCFRIPTWFDCSVQATVRHINSLGSEKAFFVFAPRLRRMRACTLPRSRRLPCKGSSAADKRWGKGRATASVSVLPLRRRTQRETSTEGDRRSGRVRRTF